MPRSTRQAPPAPAGRERAHRHRSVAALKQCDPCLVRLHRFIDPTPLLAALLALHNASVDAHFLYGVDDRAWEPTCDVCAALRASARLLNAAGLQPQRLPRSGPRASDGGRHG